MTGVTLPKPKRPRSQAQVDAFEKARRTREDNLRKKFEAEAAAAKPVAEPVPEADEPDEPDHPPAVVEAPKRTESDETVAAHDQYIDFDPDQFRTELFGKLDDAHSEIRELRSHIDGLNSKHDELQTSWQKHGVRTANMLNFV